MRRIVLLLALFVPVACTSWVATKRPISEVLPEGAQPPESIRIYDRAGTMVELQSPRLVDDTIVGNRVVTPLAGETVNPGRYCPPGSRGRRGPDRGA